MVSFKRVKSRFTRGAGIILLALMALTLAFISEARTSIKQDHQSMILPATPSINLLTKLAALDTNWPAGLSRIFGSRSARALSPVPAPMAICSWTGAGGDGQWATALNWTGCTGGGAPAVNDFVFIDNTIAAGSYTVTLPAGATTVSIAKLQIAPDTGNAITVTLPSANTGVPGFSVGDNTSGTDDIIINSGGILKNSSGAASGNGIEVNTTSSGTIRINNGGKFVHNTARSTDGIVPRLSTVAGTETGVFEYDSPGTGAVAITASGMTYGSLTLTRTAGAATYTSTGGSPLTIRGPFLINSGVTYNNSGMGGAMNMAGDLTNNGAALSLLSGQAVVFNGTSAQTVSGSNIIVISGTATVNSGATVNFSGSSSITLAGAVTVNSGGTVNLNRDVAAQANFTVNGTLNCGTSILSGNATFQNSMNSTLVIGSPDGINSPPPFPNNIGNIQTLNRNYYGFANYTYAGTSAQVTGNGLPTTLGRTLTISNSAGVTLSQNTTINSSLTLTSGAFNITTNTLTLGSSASISRAAGSLSGTPTFGASIYVTYTGSTAVTTGTEIPTSSTVLNILTVSNTGGVTLGSDATTNGASSVTSGATLNTGTFALGLRSSFSNSGTVNINGSLWIHDGTGGNIVGRPFNYGPSSTLVFNNTSTFYVLGFAYWTTTNNPPNVNVANTGGISINDAAGRTVNGLFQTSAPITNAQRLTFNGTCQINTGGSFDSAPNYGGSSLLKYNTGGTFNSGAEFPSTGVANVTLGTTTQLNLDSNKTITGAMDVGAHTIGQTGPNFWDISANTITLGAGTIGVRNLTVTTSLIVNNNSVDNLGLINVNGGDWSVNGYADTGTKEATVNFNGVATNTILTPTTFTRMGIGGGHDLSLAADITVNRTLTVSASKLLTNNFTCTLGPNSTGIGRTVGYVVGNLRKNIGFNQPFEMAVGTANGYSPVNLNITNGVGGSITVKAVQGAQPNVPVSAESLSRYWTLSGAGVTTDITFNYLDPTDIPGTATEANFVIQKYNGSFTQPGGSVNTSANTATITGVSSFSDWTLAEPVVLKYRTRQSGDWNDFNTWETSTDGGTTWTSAASGQTPTSTGGTIQIQSPHTVTVTANVSVDEVTVDSGGTLTVSSGPTLTIDDGTGTDLSINGTVASAGTVTNNGQTAVNGTFQLNSGGSVSGTAPTYATTSLLKYNSGGTFGRSLEWSATSGAGYPGNVQISNSTTVDLGANGGAATARQMAGDLTIDSGSTLDQNAFSNQMTAPLTILGNVIISGMLKGSANSGNSLKVGGNWTATGTHNPGNGPVIFNGSATQTITKTGSENFYRLAVDKPSGNLVLGSLVTIHINGASGDVLQILNAGGLDLNGRTLYLHNSAGTFLVSGGVRNVTGGGVFQFGGSKTVTSASSGTLVFDSSVTVQVVNSAVDFGANLTTINGRIQINPGSSVVNNPPIYGAGSLLNYYGSGTFARSGEWSATSGAGYPANVQISNTVTLNLGANGGTATARSMSGGLTIDGGATLQMAGANPMTAAVTVADGVSISGALTLSTLSGGDLNVGGNWAKTGTFTPNGRTVTFNGNGNTQTISGTNAFANLTINHTGGGSVTAAGSTLSVTELLDVVAGTFTSATQYHDVRLDGGTLALSGPISVDGNWTNNGGTFTPGTNGVTFNGASGQTITGDTSFYDFTKSVGAAQQFNFTAGSLTTVTHSLTLNGAAGQLLSLRSTSSPVQWKLHAPATQSVDYVDVKDSDASGGTLLTATNSTNSGNNVNWFFGCPGTLTVNDTGDSGDASAGDGVCATAGAVCTLRAAIQEANALSSCGGTITINFDGGLSGGTITLTSGSEIPITRAVTINGLGANLLTVDGGAGTNRIFYTNSTVTISGMTLQGGNGTGTTLNRFGGGILANGGTLVLNSVVVQNNINTDGSGGGVYYSAGSNHRIINSTLSGNQAAYGGGCDIGPSSLFIANSTISGNTITGNTGIGIPSYGSGIFASGATVTVRDSTIANNTAINGGAQGGGVFNANGTLDFGNTIIAGNTGGARPDINFGSGTITSAGYNLIGDNTSAATPFPAGNPNANNDRVGTSGSPLDAQLGSLTNNGGPTPTHALNLGSPAINNGSNALAVDPFDSSALSFDQRGAGFQRILGTTVDIGAFEALPTLSIVSTVTQAEGDSSQANMTLTVTLSGASPQTVTVHYSTANGSATGGGSCGGSVDYVTTTGTLTFDPGDTSKPIDVPICGDTTFELNETFTVTLDTPTNATIATGQGTSTGTITNDDACPTSITVNNSGDGSDATGGDGVCETASGNGICTLRAAIQEANALSSCGGTITVNFDGGLSGGTITLTSGSEIPITRAVTINGLGANLLTVDGGAGTNRIFYTNSTVTISGLTLQGGNGTGTTLSSLGGGILAQGGTLVLNSVVVQNNINTNKDAGGVFYSGGSNHRVINSTFTGNNAGFGGGFRIDSGSLFIANSTFSGNTATGTSTGIAGQGGGFFANNATVTVRNSTISNNTTTGSGQGGGVFNANGTLNFGNTIIAGNTASSRADINLGSGTITSAGYNLIGKNDSAATPFPAGNPNANNDRVGTSASPVLANLAALASNGGPTLTHALNLGSPAINNGSNALAVDPFDSSALSFDQRGTGFPRITSGTVDIGAFEATLTISGTVFNDKGITNIGSGKTVKLLVNGGSATTTTTNGSGQYSFPAASFSAGDVITVLISGATEKGATVTLGPSPTADITGLDIYRDSLIVRHENAGPISNGNLNTGNPTTDADLNAIYTVSSGTLTTGSGKELRIWTGKTFAPGGNINDGGDWTNNGTFTAGSGTVTLNGTTAQSIGGSATTTFFDFTYANTSSVFTSSATFSVSGTLAVNSFGFFTPGGGTITMNNGSTFAGAPRFSGLTIADGATVNTSTGFDVTGVLTVGTASTFSSSDTTFMRGGSSIVNNGSLTLRIVHVFGAVTTASSFTIGVELRVWGGASFTASAGTVTFGNSPFCDIVSSGTVSFNNLTITGKMTYADSFSVAGSMQSSSSFSASGSGGTATFNGSGNTQTISGTNTFKNLTINHSGAGSVTAAGSALSVTGLLDVAAGTFTSATAYNNVQIDAAGTLALSGPITVSGNWTNNGGVFTPGTNGVTFNGATGQTITGDTSFYDFTKSVASAQQFNFTAVSTTTVTHSLTLAGVSGQLLTLRSTGSPTQWKLNAPATQSVSYVDVKDSDASGGSSVMPANSTDSGNNINWFFPPTLGNYPDTSVALGANASVTPDAAPTDATSINVSSSTNFKGTFSADSATGVVRVTNAHPAGTHTVTVTAFDGAVVNTTKTFTLTVQAGTACAGASIFTNAGDTSVGSGPYSVAIGDFNNDGKQDVATANSYSNTVSVRLGDGAGGFGGTTEVSVGSGPVPVAIGDFNNDGKQDIAAANYYSATVSIRLGDGLGDFGGTTNVSVGSGPYSVAIGDFNSDGKQDIAVANFDSNTVSIRLGDGAGGFSGATEVSVGSRPGSVAIGDFNNDGKQDIAAANLSSATVSIRLGDGAGGFSGTTEVSVGSVPRSVAIGDFNNDSKQDIAAANSNSATVSIRLGDGSGGFTGPPSVSVGSYPYSVAIGDFNNDSKQDIAVANEGSSTVSIRLGDGLGAFSGTTNVSVGSGPQSVAIGDFDGDGKHDIAAANFDSNTVSIRLGQCDLPPTIAAATGLSRQQASPASNSQIATVTDDGGNGSVIVSVTSTNPSNRVSVSNITNTGGNVTADIVADCTATTATFTLQASDGSSTATDTLTVTVAAMANSAPTANSEGPYIADLGSGVTLNGSGSADPNAPCDSIVSYEWDIDNNGTYEYAGAIVPLSAAQVSALGVGPRTIGLRVRDSFGATGSAATTLNIYDNRPFASFTASPNPAACSQSISFNGSASSHGRPDRTIVSYSWEFGDGNIGSGVAVTHAYSAYGTYTAKLTVTDNNVPAKTDFTTLTINVDQGNQAPVTVPGGPYTADLGSGVSLNGSGSSDPNAACGDSIVSYAWTVGTGPGAIALSGANPSLTAAQISALGIGSHSVALAVRDTFGATGNASTTLHIYDNRPFASFTANPNPAACGQNITFDAGASSHGRPDRSLVSYGWDFGDGNTGSGVSVAHSYAAYGSYLVTLTVTDNNVPPKTANATASVVVNQGNQPPVAAPGGPYTTDLGSGASLNGSGSLDANASCGDSIVGYSWSINSGTFTLTGATPSVTAAQVSALGIGSHSVALTVTDTFGATGTANTTLTIYDNRPFASFTASPNPAACSQSISFDGSASSHGRPDRSIVSYAWEFGDGQTGTGITPTHAYSAYGTYTAKLTVTDNNIPAKTDFVTHNIVVDQGNQAPVSVPGGPYTIVVGSSVSLDGSGSSDANASCGDSIVQYNWSIDSGVVTATGANPTLPWAQISVLGVGSHSVALAVTDTFGATGSGATTLTINPPPPTLGTYPDASVALGANATVTPGAAPTDTTSINVSTSTSFNGELEADPATGIVRVTNAHPAGTYTVTVKAFGPMGSTTKTFTLTVTSAAACNGNTSFTNAADVSVGTNPFSVAIGDFNNDGKQDIAAANADSDTISIGLGDGAGGFGGTTVVSVGDGPNGVAVGDFNNDGKQDLAVANLNANTVSIRLGDGSGGFSSTTDVSVGTGPFSVAAGDFNNDGKQDLAVANALGSNTVSIRLGDGAGGFTGTTDVSVGLRPYAVAVGDFNNDGQQDFATANNLSASVSIRLGDGAGGFSGTTNVSVGTLPWAVAIGDFNNDGKQDIAAANESSNAVSIRMGDGLGGFSGTTDVSVGSNPRDVAIGDFNNDGKQDIAAGNAVQNTVSIRMGDGAGGFSGTTDVSVGSYPKALAIGDFNNDGKQDFVAANSNSNSVSVRLGGCTPVVNLSVSTNAGSEAGTTAVTVTATVSEPVVGNQTVSLGVSGTSITAGDYTLSNSTITILNGAPTGSVTFTVVDDAVYEGTETATLTISTPSSGIALGTTTTQNVTITDNDSVPGFSIDDVTHNEGNAGTTSYTFTVTRTGSTALSSAVNFTTVDGTATTANNDYQANSGTLTFLSAETTKTITVLVNGDTAFEPDETLTVHLSGASGATISDADGTGAVTNDDSAPTFAIDDVTHNEGNAGTTSYTFTVTRTGSTALNSSVNFTTVDGTATTANNDYQANSGTLTFLPTDTTKTITVLVNGDTTFEGNEAFTVHLSSASSATIADADGTGTITNDDSAPTFAIDDVTHNEGNAGTTSYTFTVTRTGNTALSSSVNFATVDGTATTADNDYQANAGTLNFLAADTTKTITVLVNGDATFEPDEAFTVHLSGASGATISDADGTAAVTNDDTVPTFAIDDVTHNEGNAGTTSYTFTVTRTGGTALNSSLNFATVDGTATTAGNDYQSQSGTLNFAPADTTKQITVLVNGETTFEGNEAFTVHLSGASGATIGDADGTGTITNDDSAPTLAIDDVTHNEGNAGTTSYTFTVTRTGSTALNSSLNFTTVDGTATTADNDHQANSGTLTFLPADTTKQITVLVSGDATFELNEAFTVHLSGASSATISDADGAGTITNDDIAPTFAIDDLTHSEGNTATTSYTFTVTRTGSTALNSSVNFTAVDGMATTADNDYQANSGTLTFLPADTTRTITVLINGDTKFEPDEAFTVHLSGASSATISDADGSGTVTNDDNAPTFAIDDVAHNEGDAGTTSYTFTVTKTGSTALNASVNFATVDGSATTANNDYQPNTGTLAFLPADTTKTITVLVNGDTIVEPDETFTVHLSGASGATLSDADGTGTITNDDLATPTPTPSPTPTPTPTASPIQLILDASGPAPDQVAALDALLFLRDPFPVVSEGYLLSPGMDRNTRVMIFVTNLQLAPGETSAAVVVNLIDSNSQIFDITAEDVRPVAGFDFTQMIFRLPDNLPAGTCTISVKAHGQTSNAGTIRIRT